jgi:hypothetical protein
MSIRGRRSDTFLALLEGPLRSAQPIFWQAPDGWHCYDDAPSPTESVDDARSLGGYTTYQIPEWSQHPQLGDWLAASWSMSDLTCQRK